MPRGLIDAVRNGVATEEALRKFVDSHKEEGLHLEYKSGKALQKKEGAQLKGGRVDATSIRKYVAGFANSDGGLLILGVDESDNFAIDGCPKVGGRSAADWTERAYQDLAPFLYPPPRTALVNTTIGDVVIVEVPRSDHMVPCHENGTTVFYLRIGSSTVAAPTYLVEDLYLERRRRPSFVLHAEIHEDLIAEHEVKHAVFHDPFQDRNDRLSQTMIIDIRIRGENASLQWANDALLGFVYLDKSGSGDDMLLPESLHSSILVDNKPKGYGLRADVRSVGTIAPMQMFTSFRLSSPRVCVHDRSWEAAVFMLARNMPPMWWEFALRFGPITRKGRILATQTLPLVPSQKPRISILGPEV